jgi:hypothetical protein
VVLSRGWLVGILLALDDEVNWFFHQPPMRSDFDKDFMKWLHFGSFDSKWHEVSANRTDAMPLRSGFASTATLLAWLAGIHQYSLYELEVFLRRLLPLFSSSKLY